MDLISFLRYEPDHLAFKRWSGREAAVVLSYRAFRVPTVLLPLD